MVKVYGMSDDLVEIEGSSYKEDEIGCFNSDVKIWFTDGTLIRVSYGKDNLAVWGIKILQPGTADCMNLIECDDEDAEIYSDIFEISAEIKMHEVMEGKW